MNLSILMPRRPGVFAKLLQAPLKGRAGLVYMAQLLRHKQQRSCLFSSKSQHRVSKCCKIFPGLIELATNRNRSLVSLVNTNMVHGQWWVEQWDISREQKIYLCLLPPHHLQMLCDVVELKRVYLNTRLQTDPRNSAPVTPGGNALYDIV